MNGEQATGKQWRLPLPATTSTQPHTGEIVVTLAPTLPDDAQLTVKLRDAVVAWSPGQAWISASPEMAELLLPGIIAFVRVESELSLLEQEVHAAWPPLDDDCALAFDATPADLKRSPALSERVAATFRRRIRLAQIEPRLLVRSSDLSPVAATLAEKLFEAADSEDRMEILDGQCEVFEHIYEMGSQRLGEFRAAHSSARIEWIIVALLAAEIVLMLLTLWERGATR